MYLALLLILQSSMLTATTEKSCHQNQKLDCHDSQNLYVREKNYQDSTCLLGHDLCASQETDKPFKADPRFEGVYTFPVKKLPRMNCFDPDAMKRIENELPVILENCSFASSAFKWDLDYLDKNLRDEGHIVYISKQRRFLYFDEDKLVDKYENWKPPHQKTITYFHDFMELTKTLKQSNNGTRSYFQSPLYIVEGVSNSLVEDINSFDYPWLLDIVARLGWGDKMINLLLIGMTDVVTPTHYDVLENFFVQIAGLKRLLLFRPEYFRCLYPYPVGHPHDRQSQVNFDDPDFRRFPKFKEIEGLEAILGPEDVLYIPTFWWHYVESERDNMTVSLNFWFDPKNVTINNQTLTQESSSIQNKEPQTVQEEEIPMKKKVPPKREMTPAEEIALKREVESILHENTRDHKKVQQILNEILSGRFDFLDSS